MKITQEILKKTIHNSLEIAEKDGILYPQRFTKKQQEAFDNLTIYHLSSDHTRMTAGITIEFETTSGFFELRYKILNGYRDRLCTFDVYENSNLVKTYTINPATNDDGHIRHTFEKEGRNKVVIYMPYTLEVGIESLEIEDGTDFDIIEKRQKQLLFLGDSITHGMISGRASGGFAMNLSQLFDEYECLNQGISALCYAEEMLDEELPFNPELIVVALGTNDWRRRESKKELDECVNGYIDKLVKIYKNSKIVVVSPLWRTDWKDERPGLYMFSELHGVIEKACSTYKNITVINGSNLLHHMRMFYVDGVHPNDLGHAVVAMNLYKEIEKTYTK